MKRLGDGELEIMLAIWRAEGPVQSGWVQEQLWESRPWALPAVITALNRLVDKLEKKAHLKGQKVTKYKYLGLMLFVAIPLPGTGAWTGALAAAFLDMPLRKAIPSIFTGVLVAGIAISILTFGVASLF